MKNCRKLFNSIGIILKYLIILYEEKRRKYEFICLFLGVFVPCVASIALIFVDCTIPLVGVALVIIGYGPFGCVIASGFIVNLNDIGGKHYAGVLFGISNTFGTIPGILAVGLMTPHVTF